MSNENYESDESLDTQDMDTVKDIVEPTEVVCEPVEQLPHSPVPVSKPKRKYTKKPVKQVAEEEVEVKTAKLIPKSRVKKDPKTVVYVIEKDDGSFEEIPKSKVLDRPPKKLTRKEQKQLLVEEEAIKEEVGAGKRLTRRKDNSVDKRTKPRSAAQIAATKRLCETMKARREAKKLEKEAELHKTVEKTIKQVVNEEPQNRKPEKKSSPIPIPRKDCRRNEFC